MGTINHRDEYDALNLRADYARDRGHLALALVYEAVASLLMHHNPADVLEDVRGAAARIKKRNHL